jgi:NAD(P)-dependent dehydrogenase (short-subunit alcohol dehydrogenase family)
MELQLTGSVALVTGASSGVGREIALALAKEGASIALNYNRSADETYSIQKEIIALGGKAMVYQADVGSYEEVKKMVDQVVKDFGTIDILINNAGYTPREFFVNSKPEDWEKQIRVGLYGVMNTSHVIAPMMINKKYGRIINFGGDSARVGESGLSVTAASRGGVIALSKSLAKELGRDNITCNVVTFGLLKTAHSDEAWLEKNLDKILKFYPLKRIGVPEDVAPMVTFLASKASSWITGQTISINGGFAML